jgi:hypothetical protein
MSSTSDAAPNEVISHGIRVGRVADKGFLLHTGFFLDEIPLVLAKMGDDEFFDGLIDETLDRAGGCSKDWRLNSDFVESWRTGFLTPPPQLRGVMEWRVWKPRAAESRQCP